MEMHEENNSSNQQDNNESHLEIPQISRQNSSSSTTSNTNPLPDAASHSYLGNPLHEIYSRSILQPNQRYEILLQPLPDVVVFPTETVPLRIQNRELIRKLGELIKEAKRGNQEIACHIGIVRLLRHGGIIEKIGTTVEVKSTHNNTTVDDEELIVTAKGRHRFEVLKIKRTQGVLSAEVRILGDYPCKQTIFRSPYNSFPKWVYESNSPKRLAKAAYDLFESNLLWKGEVNSLKRWGPLDPNLSSRGLLGAEEDPIGFSFYLSANLPNPSSDLQELLKAPDVIERLRLAIGFMKRSRQLKSISCVVCNQVLANKGDIFNVPGAEGCAGAYVNCHGAVHQTITFRKLDPNAMIELSGRPSTQDSWFPGFAWTIVSCQRCFNHLGWRFTPANQTSSQSFDSQENMRSLLQMMRNQIRGETNDMAMDEDENNDGDDDEWEDISDEDDEDDEDEDTMDDVDVGDANEEEIGDARQDEVQNNGDIANDNVNDNDNGNDSDGSFMTAEMDSAHDGHEVDAQEVEPQTNIPALPPIPPEDSNIHTNNGQPTITMQRLLQYLMNGSSSISNLLQSVTRTQPAPPEDDSVLREFWGLRRGALKESSPR